MDSHFGSAAWTVALIAPAAAFAHLPAPFASPPVTDPDVDGMRFGRSVLALTDLDGDGTPDFAVGAPTAAPDAHDPARNTEHAGAVLVLSGATREVLQVWRGEPERPTFGHQLRALSDVDGDNVPDVLVGYEFSARAEVLSGVDGSLHLAFDRAFAEVLELGDVDRDGAVDFLLRTGAICEVRSGADGRFVTQSHRVEPDARLSAVGDLDGDGLTDFLAAGAKSEWLMSAMAEPDLSQPFTLFYYKDRVRAGTRTEAPWGALGPSAIAHEMGRGRVVVRQRRGGNLVLLAIDPLQGARAFEGAGHSIGFADPKDWLGYALARIGNVDADGTEDFVTAHNSTVIACSGKDGKKRWDWSMPFELSFHGASIAACGDQDGDGVDDVLVGSAEKHWHGPVWRNGAVTLLSGKTGKELWKVTEGSVEARFPRRKK